VSDSVERVREQGWREDARARATEGLCCSQTAAKGTKYCTYRRACPPKAWNATVMSLGPARHWRRVSSWKQPSRQPVK
ncbi:hypothetical protein COCCADRAFT_102537, partial [Bipolaris zeicola 26-R-13]